LIQFRHDNFIFEVYYLYKQLRIKFFIFSSSKKIISNPIRGTELLDQTHESLNRMRCGPVTSLFLVPLGSTPRGFTCYFGDKNRRG